MLIRSQDKLQLIPLEIGSISIGYRDAEDNQRVYFYDSGSTNPTSTLGLYSTKEKAIKILDMIQDAYARYKSGNVYTDSSFQMPQDSEVDK